MMDLRISSSTHMEGFLKWWVPPTTIGFPTKNDHDLGCEMGGKPTILEETPTCYPVEKPFQPALSSMLQLPCGPGDQKKCHGSPRFLPQLQFCSYKVGPLLVINGGITPINGLING